jgi:hypothetical protein
MNAPALPATARPRAWRPPAPAVALGVGLLLAVGTTAWLGQLVQHERASDAAREQALAAARVHARRSSPTTTGTSTRTSPRRRRR